MAKSTIRRSSTAAGSTHQFNMWGIIPAAGAGSRIQPLAFSKELLPVGGVEVRSERVLPTADHQGLQEVGLELTLTGSIRDTAAALARLERTDRLLALRDVKIRVVAPGQARELLTTLTIAGYLLPRT